MNGLGEGQDLRPADQGLVRLHIDHEIRLHGAIGLRNPVRAAGMAGRRQDGLETPGSQWLPQTIIINGEIEGKLRRRGGDAFGHPLQQCLALDAVEELAGKPGRFQSAGYDDRGGWHLAQVEGTVLGLQDTRACGVYNPARMDKNDQSLTTQPLTKELVVQNKMGIHARPAAMIVRITNKFKADVFVEKDEEQVNGKSIMGLMMLAAGKGSKVKFIATGDDAPQMLAELDALFTRKFDEA